MKSNKEMLDFVKSVLKDVEKDQKQAIEAKNNLVKLEQEHCSATFAKLYLDRAMDIFGYDKQIEIIKFIISVIED